MGLRFRGINTSRSSSVVTSKRILAVNRPPESMVPHHLIIIGIDEMISYDFRSKRRLPHCLATDGAGNDIATSKFACLVLRVDVTEFHKRGLIAMNRYSLIIEKGTSMPSISRMR